MKKEAVHYTCDACGAVYFYGLGGIPRAWVETGLRYVDNEGCDLPLHVCDSCAKKAVDAWLPEHTWWGSTEHWKSGDDG